MTARFTFSDDDARLPHQWAETTVDLSADCDRGGPLHRMSDALVEERPHLVFVPDHHERMYPYPLIVWLHGPGLNERELIAWMPEISDRNHFGLAIRGPLPDLQGLAGRFRWPRDPGPIAEDIRRIVCDMRRTWNLHTERIFLAGRGPAAALAVQVLLARPDWFAGAVAIDGARIGGERFWIGDSNLRGKRLFLGWTQPGDVATRNAVVEAVRPLHSAGVDVAMPAEEQQGTLPAVARAIDAWIITGVQAAP